jgi:hypothetical protein
VVAQKVASFESNADLKQIDQSGKYERASVWVELYANERHEIARVAKACADAGVQERQITLAEEQGLQMATPIGTCSARSSACSPTKACRSIC